MKIIDRHQVMLRPRPSFGFFCEAKKVVGELTPTTQDRLQYKASTKAFFQLMSKLVKHVENKMKINLDFNTVSCAMLDEEGGRQVVKVIKEQPCQLQKTAPL